MENHATDSDDLASPIRRVNFDARIEGNVVQDAFLGAMGGSIAGGLFMALVGGLAGGYSERLMRKHGEFAAMLGGGLACALAVTVIPLLSCRSWRILFVLMGTFVLMTAGTMAFYWALGQRLEGNLYPWALTASLPGIIMGSVFLAMMSASGISTKPNPVIQARNPIGTMLEELVKIIISFIARYSSGIRTAIVAGGMGGLVGGLIFGVIMAAQGGTNAAAVMGGVAVIPAVMLGCGVVGGMIAGWTAWRIRTGLMKPLDNPEVNG